MCHHFPIAYDATKTMILSEETWKTFIFQTNIAICIFVKVHRNKLHKEIIEEDKQWKFEDSTSQANRS